jgi:superfamily II DNA or RNA helicase
MAEGKLNIVAAPGSGKTILGLELIRRCGKACLIISPTVATRDHWGKRFREYFLADECRFKMFFSTDVEHAAVINAMTYEELEDYTERYATDGEKKSFKLRRMMREKKIQTICLEEPHHLKPECLAALGKMQEVLEKDVTIISLTTTPPCAYEEEELKHFQEVCGEIDVQILASELVAEGVLCPHQDYIYFNMPTEEEEALFREHMEKVESALKEIGRLPCVKASIMKS